MNNLKKIRELVAVTILFCATWIQTNTSHAGGFEYAGAGAVSLGRGGAFHARADNPLTLGYNPANLAALDGMQLNADLNVGILNACVKRTGTYGDADTKETSTKYGRAIDFGNPDNSYQNVAYPETCNSGLPGIVPQIAFTARLSKYIGIGVGLVGPAAIATSQWGEGKDFTVDASGSPTGKMPSPLRYMLSSENILLAYPTVGLGFYLHPRIRMGLAFGWGIGSAELQNVVRPYGNETLSEDLRTDLKVYDYFIPKLTTSIHLIPHNNIDMMLGFMMQDDLKAKGKLTIQSGTYLEEPIAERTFNNAKLESKLPWHLQFGLRYGHPIHATEKDAPPPKTRDPLANEHWDIELNLVYEMNKRVDKFTLTPPADASIPISRGINGLGTEILITQQKQAFEIPHQWRDQLSLRLGGDYNIIPGKLAARLGFSFETAGQDKKYAQVDFMPHQRIGAHLGGTVRLGSFDISLAYAYFHQESFKVTNGKLLQIAAQDDFAEVTTINNGSYKSNIHALALGANYKF